MRRMRKAWGYRSVLAGLVVGLTMTGGSVMAADEATPAAGQATGQVGTTAPTGNRVSSRSRMFSMVSTSLCRKNTCPPRLNSRNTASRTLPSLKGLTKVLTARRRLGAVVISEKFLYYNIYER